jgi:F-type H+-transporting ATPase subunit b
MMFVIAGGSGLEFVSSGFIGQAQAQESAPANQPAPVPGAAPADGSAPTEGAAPADADSAAHGSAPAGEAAPGTHEGTAPTDPASHGAAGNASEVEQHETGIFPPFNSEYYTSQLFWLVIIFGLFYLFLRRVVMPQVGGIIETREGRIAQDLEQANRAKAEADAAVAAYEQALAEARGKASAIGQQARDAAKADAEAERKQVESGLDAKLAESQARIDGIKASAMSEVGAIAADTAEAIVQALTGRDADRAAVEAAVARSRG